MNLHCDLRGANLTAGQRRGFENSLPLKRWLLICAFHRLT